MYHYPDILYTTPHISLPSGPPGRIYVSFNRYMECKFFSLWSGLHLWWCFFLPQRYSYAMHVTPDIPPPIRSNERVDNVYPRTPDLIPSYLGSHTLVPRISYPRTPDLIPFQWCASRGLRGLVLCCV